MESLQTIELAEIQPSRTNPRKNFDDTYIAELGGSMRTVGVLEPLLVRPLDGAKKNGVAYELVAGECRYRAAKLVGMPSVPCVVRKLTDVQVLEHQVIENLQRQDLHPLEEADGYRRLMTTGKYDVEKLATRVHKSTKYIYDRIKLLQLVPELQRLFLENRINAAHAVILARLSSADQTRAMDKDEGGLWQHEEAEEYLFTEEERKKYEALKPRTSRELQGWVDQRVRFNHKKTPDPMLFPETAKAMAAEEDKERIVPITFEYQVRPEARDGTRIYGPRSWKYADGEEHEDPVSYSSKRVKSKSCDKARLGVVVAGESRGASFRVCVSKSCEIHWPAQAKKAKKKGSAAATAAEPKRDSWEERQRREREEAALRVARWREILPAVKKAVAAAVNKANAGVAGPLAPIILQAIESYGSTAGAELVPAGRSAEEFVRSLAFRIFLRSANGEFYRIRDAAVVAKKLGVDVDKIRKTADAAKPAAGKAKPKKRGAK